MEIAVRRSRRGFLAPASRVEELAELRLPAFQEVRVVCLVLPEDALHRQAAREVERHFERALGLAPLSAREPLDEPAVPFTDSTPFRGFIVNALGFVPEAVGSGGRRRGVECRAGTPIRCGLVPPLEFRLP